MKKNLFYAFWAVLLISFIISCSKEDAPVLMNEDGGDIPASSVSNVTSKTVKLSLKAYRADEGDGDTKTSLGGKDLTSVIWSPNERISLFYKDVSYDDFYPEVIKTEGEYCGEKYWTSYVSEHFSTQLNYAQGSHNEEMSSIPFKFTSNNTVATHEFVEFEGVIQKFTTGAGKKTERQIVALYPRNQEATLKARVNVQYSKTGVKETQYCSTNPSQYRTNWHYSVSYNIDTVSHVLTTSLPSYQVATENSFADSLNISVAKGKIHPLDEKGDVLDGSLYFYNVCSGFCFTVAHDDITAVEIEGLNGENLAGTFEVDLVGAEPVVTNVTETQKTVTVVAPNGTFKPGVQYYAVTLPVTFSNGFIVTGIRADGKGYEKQITKAGGIKFNRSKFARKQNFDEGMSAVDVYTYSFDGTAPDKFMFASGVREYTVTSYRTRISTGKTEPMAWKVQVSNDGGSTYTDLTEDNKSALGVNWLTFSPNGAVNNTTGPESFSVSAETAEIDDATSVPAELYHADILENSRAADIYEGASSNMSGKAAAIDLSLYDANGRLIPGGRSTANCYVVRAPGWYKIPLVWGNTIKHGSLNTSSYHVPSWVGNYYDLPVPNQFGSTGIYDQECLSGMWIASLRGPNYIKNATKLSLLWQDSENLIKAEDIVIRPNDPSQDISSTTELYAYFFVSKNNIKQGNAVIALTDKIESDPDSRYPTWMNEKRRYVLWSWHIWVTDEDFSTINVANKAGIEYEFLPVNLGWCAVGDRIDYKSRSAKVRICQIGSGYYKDFDIIQDGKQGQEPTGNNPFYQWGRKDPQLASSGLGNYAKDYWGSTGVKNDGTLIVANDMGIYTSYTHDAMHKLGLYNSAPYAFNITKNWQGVAIMDNFFTNLWSINSERLGGNEGEIPLDPNDEIVVKTIYDPCPYGFTVPASGAFSGFTTATTADGVGMGGANTQLASGAENGFHFYTNSSMTNTIFFPLTGIRRQSTGDWADLGEDGYYWSAHAAYYTSGYSLQFGCLNSTELVPNDNYDDGTKYVMLRTNYKGTGYSVRPAVDKSL